jgi:hypothetical protein
MAPTRNRGVGGFRSATTAIGELTFSHAPVIEWPALFARDRVARTFRGDSRRPTGSIDFIAAL